MMIECSRVRNHPKAESRLDAIRQGWCQDKKAKWVCPLCRASLKKADRELDARQRQKRARKHKKASK